MQSQFITPCLFKFGSRLLTSFEPLYVLTNVLTKLKQSSIAGDENFILTKNEIYKVEYKILKEKELEVSNKGTTGLIGKVIYYIDNNEELNKRLTNLLNFAYFSGIGYCTQEGYGQIGLK